MGEVSLYLNRGVVAARGGIKAVAKAMSAHESSWQNMESEGRERGGGGMPVPLTRRAPTPVGTELINGLQGCLTYKKMHSTRTLP